MDLLEAIVYRLDSDEDMRIKHSREYDLIDEFDCEEVTPTQPPPPPPSALTTVFVSQPAAVEEPNAVLPTMTLAVSQPIATQKIPDLSILSAPVTAADAVAHVDSALVYQVPDIEYPTEPAEGADAASRTDAILLTHIGDYRRYIALFVHRTNCAMSRLSLSAVLIWEYRRRQPTTSRL
jgi:hypothetical protein